MDPIVDAPVGLSPTARALYYLSTVIAPTLDGDVVKIVKYRLMKRFNKFSSDRSASEGGSGADAVLEAFEAFHVTKDVGRLIEFVNEFVAEALRFGSQGIGIGTPIVQSPAHRSSRDDASSHRSSVPRNSSLPDFTGIHAPSTSPPPSQSPPMLSAGCGVTAGTGFAGGRITVGAGDAAHARLMGSYGRITDYSDLLSPAPGPLIPVTIVYYAREMAEIAHELANGRAKCAVHLHEIDWKSFPDTFPNLFIHDIKDCRFNNVMFLASFHSMSAIIEQISVIYTLPSYSIHLAVLIPFFPTATMERISTIGEVATAKTLARMLSATPLAAQGPTQFSILDIHALQEQFYFSDSVHIRLKSCISLLHDRLLRLEDAATVSIAFPDEGALKRFHGKLDIFGEPIVCVKRRDGDKRRIVISEGEPRGRHCVIVDDLVQTGGTLLECARALRDAGAASISAYVTHAVFPHDSWKKFMPEEGKPALLKYFWITNSIPTTAEKVKGVNPFEVLSIVPIIEDVLGI